MIYPSDTQHPSPHQGEHVDHVCAHNVAQTHNVIAKLSKYSEFTATQANNIVETAISNAQIYQILSDKDVHDFITSVIKSNQRKIDYENLKELSGIITLPNCALAGGAKAIAVNIAKNMTTLIRFMVVSGWGEKKKFCRSLSE